jgi:hypothetical protein
MKEEKRQGKKIILKLIMAENPPNLANDINLYVQKN